MEKEIIKIIKENGPLIGAEIIEKIDAEPLLIWRECRNSESLTIRVIGTRYMRLDRRIEDFARLSPSILREFLTYTIIGLSSDKPVIEEKAEKTLSRIEEISRSKSQMAYGIASTLVERIGNDDLINEHTCFIIAGDIVFNMAHDVPRPERSTGKLVRGSDMDIVVVVDDQFPRSLMKRLDDEIYKEKFDYLMNPHLREEIDYVVKTLDRVREQLKFNDFRKMVACKILHEGTLLFGSEKLFHKIKMMLKDCSVLDRLDDMERKAILFRKSAEEYLMKEDVSRIKAASLNLFYPTEESEEFE